MRNDLYPYFEYLTQKQLGQAFGVSGQKIGRWLIEEGVRGPNCRPTAEAEQTGLARAVEDGDVVFHSWHKERVVQILERAGHRRLQPVEQPGAPAQPPAQVQPSSALPSSPPAPVQSSPAAPAAGLNGPFTTRRSGQEGDGHEIVSGDGTVAVWVWGEANATKLVQLMNLAHAHKKM